LQDNDLHRLAQTFHHFFAVMQGGVNKRHFLCCGGLAFMLLCRGVAVAAVHMRRGCCGRRCRIKHDPRFKRHDELLPGTSCAACLLPGFVCHDFLLSA